jgi:toxin HigB-1
MILSFKDKRTKLVFGGQCPKGFPPQLFVRAMAKLKILHAVRDLETLRVPPGNQLEALKGDRSGQHSIRINGQFRLCFTWNNNGAHDVEITDYH